WQSSGRSVRRNKDSTTGSPMVRFGTKWPSITSTCTQSARASPEPAPASLSVPRSAKPADKILRALNGSWATLPSVDSRNRTAAHGCFSVSEHSGGFAQHRAEHRIGAVPMRPQLHRRTVTEVGHTRKRHPRVDQLRTETLGTRHHDSLGLG